MRLLLVHPSALMYSEIFLRLEPLGLERVAAAAREVYHEVRVVDLQVLREADLRREVFRFRPDVVGFSLNYLANIPEAIDLARAIKRVLPRSFVFFGGHSVSFVAEEVLEQAGARSTPSSGARANRRWPRSSKRCATAVSRASPASSPPTGAVRRPRCCTASTVRARPGT